MSACAVVGLPVRIEAKERVVAVARLAGPAIDAVAGQPPAMNDQHAERDRRQESVGPSTACPGGGSDDDGHAEQGFEQTTPPGPVFFESTKVEMPEHESSRSDGDIEPIRICAPH